MSVGCRVSRLVIFLPLVLGGWTYVRPENQPLSDVWVSARPLGALKACIIKGLNRSGRTYSRISPSVRHVARTVVARKVIEIHPVYEHALVDVNYHVRLEKIHDVITRVALYVFEVPQPPDFFEPQRKHIAVLSITKSTSRVVSRCSR
jgi:hypothetical protein